MSRLRMAVAALAVLPITLLAAGGPGAGAAAATGMSERAVAKDAPTSEKSKPAAEKSERAASWKLHWIDEFNGSTLSSIWSHKNPPPGYKDTCTYTSPHKDFDRNKNSSDNSVVKVSNGTLHLLVRKKVCANGKVLWKSGAITTKDRMEMETGLTWRITAKIRFPQSSGNHGALWSLAVDPGAAGPQELDMAESFGSQAKMCTGHTWLNYYWIYGDPNARVKQCMKRSPNPWGAFHTYKVLWKNGEYARVYIDGVKRGELLGAAVPNTPEYLLLTNLVNDGKKVGPAGKETSMQVGWIKTEYR